MKNIKALLENLDHKRLSLPVIVLVFLTLSFLLIFHAIQYDHLIDDAFISFRYAHNISQGWGAVFNQGERVEGYTCSFWVFLLGLLKYFGADIPAAARLIGFISGILTLPMTYLIGRRIFNLSPIVSLFSPIILVSSSSVVMWMGSGMETPLYMLLLTLSLYFSIRALDNKNYILIASLLSGIAYLNRPEAAGIITLFAFIAVVINRAHLPTVFRILAIVYGAFIIPQLLIRYIYYGYPLPNTFYVKAPRSLDILLEGIKYTGNFFLSHGFWGLPLISAIFLRLPGNKNGSHNNRSELKRNTIIIIAVIAFISLYITSVGGDFYPYFRFCVPYLPFLSAVLVAGAYNSGRYFQIKFQSVAALPAIITICFSLLLAVSSKFWPDSISYHRFSSMKGNDIHYEMYGKWLRQNMPPDTVIALSVLGRISYYSELTAIDMLGLTDAEIAHTKIESQIGRIAHQKYNSDYIVSRKPDIIIIEIFLNDDQLKSMRRLNASRVYKLAKINATTLWPAIPDMLTNENFRRNYTARVESFMPGSNLIYFRRDERLVNLENFVKNRPDDIDALQQLARLYHHHGLSKHSMVTMQKVISARPGRPRPHLEQAYFLYDEEQFQLALFAFKQIKDSFPGYAEADYGIALSLAALNRPVETIPYLESFIRKKPRDRFAPRAQKMLEKARAIRSGN